MRGVIKLAQSTMIKIYLRTARRIWWRLPMSVRSHPIFLSIGAHLHSCVLRFSDRQQNHSTFFLRNRAELELIKRLAGNSLHDSALSIAVLACSKGAEVYSVAWALKTARPDLAIKIRGIDVSHEMLDFASRGIYSLQALESGPLDQSVKTEEKQLNWNTHRDQQGYSLVGSMSDIEKEMMFDRVGNFLRVKAYVREGITWHCADANDPRLVGRLGKHDMVMANRFMCHMKPAAAERTLRTIASMIKPGGYLFVSGVDLDVRERVARGLNWRPVTDLMEAIHEGDPSLRTGWPFDYWAKEPFQPRRPDASIRYAGAFVVQ
jgi:chemotaxis methyl-accepting protein methylase